MIFESLINLGLNFKTFFEVVEVTAANMMAMKGVNKKQISKQKNKQKHFCLQDHLWNKKFQSFSTSKTNPISKGQNFLKVSLFLKILGP